MLCDGHLTDAAVGQNYTLGVPSSAAGVHDTRVVVVSSLASRAIQTDACANMCSMRGLNVREPQRCESRRRDR